MLYYNYHNGGQGLGCSVGGRMMIKLKACPKCHGDLYLQKDQYGRYMNCLQCGYLLELLEEPSEFSLSEGSRRTPAGAEQLAA